MERPEMEFENKNEFNECKSKQERFWDKAFELKYWQLSESQIKKITQRLPQKAKILEIGSHKGSLLEQLKNSGNEYELVGSDITDKASKYIKEKTPEAKFIKIDIIKDAIPDKFDVIFMKLTLGCLRNYVYSSQEELWDKVLEKVKNSCNQLVLITPMPKEGANVKNNRQIFVPNDILQKLLDKHFRSKELLEVQKEGMGNGSEEFNMEIYLLSEPKID